MPSFTKTRTTTYDLLWLKKDWLPCDDSFKKVRSKCRNPMTSCIKCGHRYKDGEMMSLGCFDKKGNKTLCRNCADELVPGEDNYWSKETKREKS